jgi:FkbM family methyltransferase
MNKLVEKYNCFLEKRIDKNEYLDYVQNYKLFLNSILELKRITNSPQSITINSNGIIFLINGSEFFATPQIKGDIITNTLFLAHYESDIFSLIDILLLSGEQFIDIGSNVGLHAIYAARHNQADVICFEPAEINFKALIDNINLNHLDKKITCFNYALGDNNETKDFFYNSVRPAASGLKKLIEDDQHIKESISIHKLDDLELSIRKVNLMKIDTEGSELFVIKGAVNTIRKYRPFVIVEILRKWSKVHDYKPNDILDIFFNMNYLCYEISGDSLNRIDSINDYIIGTNFLFVPIESKSRILHKINC